MFVWSSLIIYHCHFQPSSVSSFSSVLLTLFLRVWSLEPISARHKVNPFIHLSTSSGPSLSHWFSYYLLLWSDHRQMWWGLNSINTQNINTVWCLNTRGCLEWDVMNSLAVWLYTIKPFMIWIPYCFHASHPSSHSSPIPFLLCVALVWFIGAWIFLGYPDADVAGFHHFGQ